MRFVAGWATDVGHARAGKSNEDSYLVDDQLALFAVADGMGGHRGGEVASTVAIEALRAAFARGDAIDAAVRVANAAVYERSAADPSLRGMGTTMTAVIAQSDNQVRIAHAGDSRAYLARGALLQRITDDHSVVEELVRAGRITPEQAAVHPQRNIITRALGVDDDIDVDLYTLTVCNNDRILLCSDGLTTMVRETDIIEALTTDADPQASAALLVDRALENGGDDNVTVIVIDISEVPERDGAPETIAEITIEKEEFAPTAAPEVATAFDDSPSINGIDANTEGLFEHGRTVLTTTRDEEQMPVARRRPSARALRYVLAAVIPFIIMFAIAYTWLRHENDRHWYVGVRDGHVALYQGSRTSPLGWEPQLRLEDTSALVSNITDQSIRDRILANRLCEGTSKTKAESCYRNTVNDTKTDPATTTTTTPTTTSSTAGVSTSTASTSTVTTSITNP